MWFRWLSELCRNREALQEQNRLMGEKYGDGLELGPSFHQS